MKTHLQTPHIPDLIRRLLELIGENPNRDGLKKTPVRYAKALAELVSGYSMDLRSVVNKAVYRAPKDTEMVIVRDIPIYSLCEHHLLPFVGTAQVAYLPKKKIIGLSKIPRIVGMFARRLQVQERLTRQIAHALEQTLEPLGTAVIVQARHMCMEMRGVKSTGSNMVTTAFHGTLRRNGPRRELFQLLFQPASSRPLRS